DPARAHHEIRGPDGDERAIFIGRDARQGARLVEGACIEKALDPLTHGEPAGLVLTLDVLGAAHLARERETARQLRDFRFPLHQSGRSEVMIGAYDTVTPMDAPPSSLRVDKWLWAARFFKTRSLAAAACAGGKIDVNDEAAKPARQVRPGDLVKVTLPRGRRR